LTKNKVVPMDWNLNNYKHFFIVAGLTQRKNILF
jgi:hypothetical protein